MLSKIVKLLLSLSCLVCFSNGLNLTLGYLPSMYSYYEKHSLGTTISGAISYAVKTINENPSLLPDVTLNLIWKDVKREDMKGAQALADLIRQDAVAFFGPERACASSATVAGAFNLPIISYRCSEYYLNDESNFPTFARTIPSDMSMAKALMSLLKLYSWNKISMVVEGSEHSKLLSETVRIQARMHNITILHSQTYQAPFILDVDNDKIGQIIENSYKKTRIYVFIGDKNAMITFIRSLHSRGLLSNGKYMVIYLDMDVYYKDEPTKYISDTPTLSATIRNSSLLDAVKSLMVLTLTPSIKETPENNNFETKVNEFLNEPPFDFPVFLPAKVPVYAYYLYDAVYLYAQALHQHLSETNLPKHTAARDGKEIIKRLRNIHYNSITGNSFYIDGNGEIQSKIALLVQKSVKSTFTDISMIPVGEFSNEEDPSLTLFDTIDWKNGEPPSVSDICEFNCDSATQNIADSMIQN